MASIYLTLAMIVTFFEVGLVAIPYTLPSLNQVENQRLSNYSHYFYDPTSTLSIEAIEAIEAKKFRPIEGKGIQLFKKGNFWIRSEFINTASRAFKAALVGSASHDLII